MHYRAKSKRSCPLALPEISFRTAMSRANSASRCFVNPPIGQALASDFLEQHVGARHIAIAHRGAVVVAEIKLGDVALKVLLAYVVVRADKAALEDREVAFHRVGGDRTARVFLLGVVDAGMLGKLFPKVPVARGFVRHQVRVLADMLEQTSCIASSHL